MTEHTRSMSRESGYKLQVADLRKNAQERLRVDLHDFNGHDLVSLRVWIERAGHEAAIPSAKGVTLTAALIPQLRQALEDAERLATERGLLAG